MSKCKILHLDSSNPKHSYTMTDISIEDVTEEKDLGIVIGRELKFHNKFNISDYNYSILIVVFGTNFEVLS